MIQGKWYLDAHELHVDRLASKIQSDNIIAERQCLKGSIGSDITVKKTCDEFKFRGYTVKLFDETDEVLVVERKVGDKVETEEHKWKVKHFNIKKYK